MKKIYIDFETRSRANIFDCGAYSYAAHPSTEILCMSFLVEGDKSNDPKILKRQYFEKVQRGEIPPPDLSNFRLVAHNAQFEFAIWEYILHRRFGWADRTDPKLWGCTMAKAAMCGLPLQLGKCGEALKINHPKDMEGAKTMHTLCKPNAKTGEWCEDPEMFEKLYNYCKIDVKAEKEIDERLPELPPHERRAWEMDLSINYRGIKADVAAARNAAQYAEDITDRLNLKLKTLTGGLIDKASRVQALRRWANTLGCNESTFDKVVLARLIADPKTPALVKEALAIRQAVGRSSTAKFQAIINAANPEDHRLRGMLQFHGAATGRSSGRMVQLQNLPKPNKGEDIDSAIAALSNGDDMMFEALSAGRPMDKLASCIRGMLIAGEGKTFLCADFSAIEVAVLMWEVNDEGALKLLRDGKGLYIPMAEYIYVKKPGEITKEGTPKEYAVGKATVLGAGYQMWWPKFKATCDNQGVHLDTDEIDAFETTEEINPDNGEKTTRKMTRSEVRAKAAIVAYRNKYPKVVQYWSDMGEAAKSAVLNPTAEFTVGSRGIKWAMNAKREFLCCHLPAGRSLYYYHPSVETITDKYGRERQELHYWSYDSEKKQLLKCKTYGGSLVENATQAIARDILVNAMDQSEKAGFSVVLTVHDELVAEHEVSLYSPEKALAAFIEQMCCYLPTWAADMPVRAEGWHGPRYRK